MLTTLQPKEILNTHKVSALLNADESKHIDIISIVGCEH